MSGWFLGITCAAMLAAVARSLMPPGPVRQVGNLICAMMLLWAILKPLNLDVTKNLAIDVPALTKQSERELEEKSGQIMKSLIEQESGTYIVDKAAQMGIACSAQVHCCQGEGNVWLPVRVRISGQLTQKQRQQIQQMISADLGIDASMQEFAGGE